jgi:hypothetical protein
MQVIQTGLSRVTVKRRPPAAYSRGFAHDPQFQAKPSQTWVRPASGSVGLGIRGLRPWGPCRAFGALRPLTLLRTVRPRSKSSDDAGACGNISALGGTSELPRIVRASDAPRPSWGRLLYSTEVQQHHHTVPALNAHQHTSWPSRHVADHGAADSSGRRGRGFESRHPDSMSWQFRWGFGARSGAPFRSCTASGSPNGEPPSRGLLGLAAGDHSPTSYAWGRLSRRKSMRSQGPGSATM